MWRRALTALDMLDGATPAERRLLGGVRLRGTGPGCRAWMEHLGAVLGPVVAVPANSDTEGLDGALDIEATLLAGRPVRREGLIARGAGGVLVLRGAPEDAAGHARLLGAMDGATDPTVGGTGDGASRADAPLVVWIDTGDDDEASGAAAALASRLAITLDLRAVRWNDVSETPFAASGSIVPRRRTHPKREEAWKEARLPDDRLAALDHVAGLLSAGEGLRPLTQLATLATLAARLDGRAEAADEDAILAIALRYGLDLAPGEHGAPDGSEAQDDGEASDGSEASQAGDEDVAADPNDPGDEGDAGDSGDGDDPVDMGAGPPDRGAKGRDAPSSPDDLPPGPPEDDARTIGADAVLAAIRAALPPGLLDATHARSPDRGREAGRAGPAGTAMRGRPSGLTARRPDPRTPLAILATLRAAVPWQRARGRQPGERIAVRPSDFRYLRRRAPTGTTVVFGVDASGSAAAERLAEAKGAVESLLADAYVRRDHVALVAFRHGGAETLLPPSRGLVRAKRVLGGVPGGGGTPLAAGLLAVHAIAGSERRAGRRAMIVLLTDGRGNVALDGRTGRSVSGPDERSAANALRALGVPVLVVDTALRPGRHAPRLAEAMGGRLVALPRATGSPRAATRPPAGGAGTRGRALGGLIAAELEHTARMTHGRSGP